MTTPLLLDGGVATHLEVLGYSLRTDLWSGQALFDGRDYALAAHSDFVDAGADVLATLTYQCSGALLKARGLEESQCLELYSQSVDLCRQAFGGRRGKVAVSVGPFGASLTDGSEYRGGYGLSVEELQRFHRSAIRWAAQSGADVLALETVPDMHEVSALIGLVDELAIPVWLSLSVADGQHLADGTALREVAACCAETEFWAVGVNCCSAKTATAALEVLSEAGLPLIVYPNSGERYEEREWQGDPSSLGPFVDRWIELGVVALGGCCRTAPEEIRAMRRVLDGSF